MSEYTDSILERIAVALERMAEPEVKEARKPATLSTAAYSEEERRSLAARETAIKEKFLADASRSRPRTN